MMTLSLCSRDAILACGLVIVGAVLLGVGIWQGQWTGVAAGGGLALVGFKALYLQSLFGFVIRRELRHEHRPG